MTVKEDLIGMTLVWTVKSYVTSKYGMCCVLVREKKNKWFDIREGNHVGKGALVEVLGYI